MGRWNDSSHQPTAGEWSRKQKRGYQRVRSLLYFWESHRFQVLWVTLSTGPGGNADKLTYHHKQLRQRIERHMGRPTRRPRHPIEWRDSPIGLGKGPDLESTIN